MKKNKNLPFLIGGALVMAVVVVGAISLGTGAGFQGYLAKNVLTDTNQPVGQINIPNLLTPSKPEVKMATSTESNHLFLNGARNLYKWTIAAPTDHDVHLKQVVINFDTVLAQTADIKLKNFKLLRNGIDISSSTSNVDIIDETGKDLESGDGFQLKQGTKKVYVQWNDSSNEGEESILAATQNTYSLQATEAFTQGSSSAFGDYVNISIANDTAANVGKLTSNSGPILINSKVSNFIWSNKASQPHSSKVGSSSADWFNGFKATSDSLFTTWS
jgi:hypothetical protein